MLVIVGLLLGGILKGRELINSARVRSLADTSSTIQAAYFGFIDRYRRVPGDWNASDATTAIGSDHQYRRERQRASRQSARRLHREQRAVGAALQGGLPPGLLPWRQRSAHSRRRRVAAQCIPPGDRDRAHFGLPGRQPRAAEPGDGRGVPVGIMRELDSKLDDGAPDTGAVRGVPANATVFTAPGPDAAHGAMEADCVSGTPLVWDLPAGARDCNGVYLF